VLIDFRHPASIAAWARINPARHVPQLRAMWKLWPEFRESIAAGMKLLELD
jgi:hypothetical protein